jgi:benzodiazapine receptor
MNDICGIMKGYYSLLVNIILPHSAGFIGSYFTISSIKTWYVTINKPSFNPPSWIFSPVWLSLYTLIGISFYLFHKKDKFKSKKVYIIYGFHLLLNAIWSIIFFRMHEICFALVDLILIIATLIILMKYFFASSRMSFYLLIPYLMWVCFAAILNYNIWMLN